MSTVETVLVLAVSWVGNPLSMWLAVNRKPLGWWIVAGTQLLFVTFAIVSGTWAWGGQGICLAVASYGVWKWAVRREHEPAIGEAARVAELEQVHSEANRRRSLDRRFAEEHPFTLKSCVDIPCPPIDGYPAPCLYGNDDDCTHGECQQTGQWARGWKERVVPQDTAGHGEWRVIREDRVDLAPQVLSPVPQAALAEMFNLPGVREVAEDAIVALNHFDRDQASQLRDRLEATR